MGVKLRLKMTRRIRGKLRVIHTFLVGHGDNFVDSADATAAAADLAEGETAYVKGVKITGTLPEVGSGGSSSYGEAVAEETSGNVGVYRKIPADVLLRAGSTVHLLAEGKSFGDASASDVVAGKTFTSASGLKVTGTYEELDTSDATATAAHIEAGQTAYVNGEKITGALTVAAQLSGESTEISQQSLRKWVNMEGTPGTKCIVDTETVVKLSVPLTKFGDAAAENVMKGKTFTSAAGLLVEGTHDCEGGTDTSDATATAADMAEGVTAYVDGVKITGNLPVKNGLTGLNAKPSFYVDSNDNSGVGVTFTQTKDVIIRAGADVKAVAAYEEFGDATAADVAKGKKFTSASGLLVTGTHECEGGIDTSDATATAVDMLAGATAYVNGEKIEGTLVEIPAGQSVIGNQNATVLTAGEYIVSKAEITSTLEDFSGAVVRPNAMAAVRVPKGQFGDAAASDVVKGKTFTSAAGLLAVGTKAEPVLEELTVTENGEYTPGEGVSGFSKVIANIAASGGGGVKVTEFVVTEDADRSLWFNEQKIKLVKGLNFLVNGSSLHGGSVTNNRTGLILNCLILWDGTAVTDVAPNTYNSDSHIRGWHSASNAWGNVLGSGNNGFISGNTSKLTIGSDGLLSFTTSATEATIGNYANSFFGAGNTYYLLQAESEVVC